MFNIAFPPQPRPTPREWADEVEETAKGWTMITTVIDPGVNTDLAVAEGGKLVRLETLDFWKAYHIVSA